MDVLLKNSFYETLNNVVDLNKDNKISRNDVDLEKIYITIWVIVKKLMRDIYKEYNEENKNEKRVYYISMEFLMGKMLKDSLINLGIEEDIKDLIEDFGYDIIDLYKFDVETKLGSGGLGRLGACYLDFGFRIFHYVTGGIVICISDCFHFRHGGSIFIRFIEKTT